MQKIFFICESKIDNNGQNAYGKSALQIHIKLFRRQTSDLEENKELAFECRFQQVGAPSHYEHSQLSKRHILKSVD